MCRIRTFPRVHCFSYLFFSSATLRKSYCYLFTGVEERLCLRDEHTYICVCVCVYVPVLVLSSRFVNYIGPDQTSYIYTHTQFIRFLILHCFFFFYCIFFTYKRTKHTHTHTYTYKYICIGMYV